MKRFFQIAGLIFTVFIAAVVTGAFLPETDSVESVAIVDAEAQDVSDYLTDLRNWPDWLQHIPADGEPVFGEPVGEGASLVWQAGDSLGSVDIVQVTDGLIRAVVMDNGEEKRLTLALAREAGGTTVLLQQERDLGGFPYLNRIQAKLGQGSQSTSLESSLQRLSAQLAG